MRTLTSKIQYKNFETGEFVEEKKRTYEETITIIDSFPWEEQRDHIVIDLTNPSVTIEGVNNDYLKLALFFNNKFVLHYLNDEKVLFTKSFTDIRDTYQYVHNLFENPSFDLSGFNKENTWLKNNIIHFVSQNFTYEVNGKRVKKYLLSTSGFNLSISLFFLLLFLIKGTGNAGIGGMIAILIVMFVVGGGLNLIVFFNFYFYSKNRILIMSKGNDIFYFGDKNNPEQFNKADILRYTTIKNRNTRSPINGFALIEVEFKNNKKILIPNLFVGYLLLEQKLYQYKRIDKNGMPWV